MKRKYVLCDTYSVLDYLANCFYKIDYAKNIPPFISSNLSPFMTRNVGFQDKPLNYMVYDYYNFR